MVMKKRSERSIALRISNSIFALFFIFSVCFLVLAGMNYYALGALAIAFAGIAAPVVTCSEGPLEMIVGFFEAILEGILGIFEAITSPFS